MSDNKKLTTVKLDEEMFQQFKIECLKRKFTFGKLCERAIHLYLVDDEFRRKLHNHTDLTLEE